MENHGSPERTVPIQFMQRSRIFRQFKNPPQPHMCIQDTIKNTSEKLFINVLGWQKISNPKQYSDPVPLYGGMQVPQGCRPNSNRPPLLVFAVMVNPDILKTNGKNAPNPTDREALVSLLCDFVEAMNTGLYLTRNPVILKDKDLAGELKDVWLAVQTKREREKGLNQDVMYKVYDIDGIGAEEPNEENQQSSEPTSPSRTQKTNQAVKSSKQILMNAGQKSEFDTGMNNCQINQNNSTSNDSTHCTPAYGSIVSVVSSRENHNQIQDIQQKYSTEKPSTSFRRDWNTMHGKTTEGWDEFSKRNISIKTDKKNIKQKQTNGKPYYDFFPVFDNKADAEIDSNIKNGDTDIILEPMQNLLLHTTDICDSKTSALNTLSS